MAMNKARRNWLTNVITALEEAKEEIESINSEEEEAYSNHPDNLNDSEMADAMYENMDSLSSAADDLQGVIDQLQEIVER